MAEYLVNLTDGNFGWASSGNSATTTETNWNATAQTFYIDNVGPTLPPSTPADYEDDLDWLDERENEIIALSRIAA